MVRRPRSAIVSALALTLLGAARVRAADDPLKIVPADALGCVIFHRLGEADAKGYKAEVQFGLAMPEGDDPDLTKSPFLKAWKAEYGIHQGLDENGSLVRIVMPSPAGGFAQVLALPVTGHREFLNQFHAAKPVKLDGQGSPQEGRRKSLDCHGGKKDLFRWQAGRGN